MLNYIIQIILFQVFFLTIYDLFLSKETFFHKNRAYLLATPVLSFLLPLIKIPTFRKAVPQEYIIYLPEVFLSPEKVIQQTTWYPSINAIDVLFFTGVLLFLILFILKLVRIILLIKKSRLVKKSNFTIVFIPEQHRAFSFFNYIFLGEAIAASQHEKIIAHELVHSKQKHSLDLLFFEILKIILWFNPMTILYQKRITLLHEYISDEVASKTIQKENYINNLLSSFFQVENIAFINQFYKQSLIKKRIIMMTKKQSKKMNQLKYLVLIPVLASMLFYVACTNSEDVLEESPIVEYKSKIKIQDELYLVRQNELGKTTCFNSNGEEVDLESLLPKNVKAMYFENGYLITEFNGRKGTLKTKDKFHLNFIKEKKEISFMNIDKAPTFPGCEKGDRDCFSKRVQHHFTREFDMKIANNLGLSSGKKRVFIGFKIDKQGNVIDIQVRAPHEKIKEEVLKVMGSLPKMLPGKNDGEYVAVNYTIPFTLMVK